MICRKVYNIDGTIIVIHPAPKSRMKFESENDWLNRIFTRIMEKSPDLIGRDFDDVDSTTLPSREFRNAWRGSKGQPIRIDAIEKAKIINEKLIIDEIEKSKRDQAISNLKVRGELPPNF